MAFQQDKHDIGLLRQDGSTKTGFILARKNNIPIYETYDDEYLARHQTTVAGYDALSPEKEFAIVRDDWRSGFGQEYHDSTDPLRYYESTNVDARSKGGIIAGPLATAIALVDYSATFTDEGLELWDDANTLTNWTDVQVNGTLTREASTVRTGTYSARLQTDVGGTSSLIKQSLSWDNKYRNVTVKVSAYFHQEDASCATISIYDGQGTTTSSTSATTGSFIQFTVERTLHASASELTISAIVTGDTKNSWVDDITWVGPNLGNPRRFAEFNNEWYMAYGDVLVKLNGAYNGWTFIKSFPGVTATDLE
ncbi:hypothetical protein LCGC14_2813020, partial [marine sediment metagenome]